MENNNQLPEQEQKGQAVFLTAEEADRLKSMLLPYSEFDPFMESILGKVYAPQPSPNLPEDSAQAGKEYCIACNGTGIIHGISNGEYATEPCVSCGVSDIDNQLPEDVEKVRRDKAIEPFNNYPYKGNLTHEEWKELVALEYVLTWNYSVEIDADEKRYKELSQKKWAFIEGFQFGKGEISRLKEENERLVKENETLEDLEAKATVRVVELEAALTAKEKECEELITPSDIEYACEYLHSKNSFLISWASVGAKILKVIKSKKEGKE